MIGIRENNFRAEFVESFIAQAFYGGLRAYGQEKRSFNGAVGRGKAAAAGASGVRLQDFERKHNFRSVSRENPGNHGEEEHESKGNRNNDAERFAEWQLLPIGGGKTNGHEQERPDAENVQKSERYHLPRGEIAAKNCSRVGSQELFGIDRAGVLEKSDGDGDEFSEAHRQVSERGDGECRAKLGARAAHQFECSQIDSRNKKKKQRPTDDTTHIADNLGALGGLFERARFLVFRQLIHLP